MSPGFIFAILLFLFINFITFSAFICTFYLVCVLSAFVNKQICHAMIFSRIYRLVYL